MSLHSLLRWAHKAWVDEAPNLDHEHKAIFDEGGAPEMKPAVASYLGLLAKKRLLSREGEDRRPDNWRALAGRRTDGQYVTPVRYAIELAPDADERAFLRALVPELYYPSEIATIYGIPSWAAAFVMYAVLERLRVRYDQLMRDQAKGTAAYIDRRPGWVSMSDSQRAATEAGEKDAA